MWGCLKTWITRWWFETSFIFFPLIPGKMIQFDSYFFKKRAIEGSTCVVFFRLTFMIFRDPISSPKLVSWFHGRIFSTFQRFMVQKSQNNHPLGCIPNKPCKSWRKKQVTTINSPSTGECYRILKKKQPSNSMELGFPLGFLGGKPRILSTWKLQVAARRRVSKGSSHLGGTEWKHLTGRQRDSRAWCFLKWWVSPTTIGFPI